LLSFTCLLEITERLSERMKELVSVSSDEGLTLEMSASQSLHQENKAMSVEYFLLLCNTRETYRHLHGLILDVGTCEDRE